MLFSKAKQIPNSELEKIGRFYLGRSQTPQRKEFLIRIFHNMLDKLDSTVTFEQAKRIVNFGNALLREGIVTS